MGEFIKKLFEKEWSKDDKVLCFSVALLAGVIIGFVLSPVKKGISMMSGNGCNNNSGNKSVSSISKGESHKISDKKDKKDKNRKNK